MEDNMNKRPSLQFYPGDWWRANDIKGCSMSTQGVWFNLLMAMWDAPEQGKLETNLDSICRIIGAKTREVNAFFRENKEHKFADVTECNGIVTIVNRRMYADYLGRKRTKDRVQEHRLRKSNINVTQENSIKCNANVTTPSSTSSSTSITYTQGECVDFGISLGISEQQSKDFYAHYKAQGWLFGNGLPITDLRYAMIRWRHNQYKFDKPKGGKNGGNDRGNNKKPFVR